MSTIRGSMAEAVARDSRDPVEGTDRDSDLVVHMGKEMDMFQLERDFNVSAWAYGQPGDRWCVLCLEVSEEPSSSRRSPALQSKMGVWPWAKTLVINFDRAFNEVELATKRRSASDRPPPLLLIKTTTTPALLQGLLRRRLWGGGGGVIVDLGTTVTSGDGGEGPIQGGARGCGGGRGGAVPHALRSESAEERERADVGLGFRDLHPVFMGSLARSIVSELVFGVSLARQWLHSGARRASAPRLRTPIPIHFFLSSLSLQAPIKRCYRLNRRTEAERVRLGSAETTIGEREVDGGSAEATAEQREREADVDRERDLAVLIRLAEIVSMVLCCGVAAGLGAAWRVADITKGYTVVIFGLGTVGLSVSSGNAVAASMVTTRPMQRPMNMMNMPIMPPGVASFNLASQANMAGGMHPGGIPMRVVRELVDMEPKPIILAYIDLNLQTLVAARMFLQHGANNHSQCSGLVNISSLAVHSADAKLKVVERGQLLKLPFTTTFDYLQLIALSMKSPGPLGSFYFAAVVSDFYVPWNSMAEHKIQSASDRLDQRLAQVPKMLKAIRDEWAPMAFCISFKVQVVLMIVECWHLKGVSNLYEIACRYAIFMKGDNSSPVKPDSAKLVRSNHLGCPDTTGLDLGMA
ncbi:hypothetical protein Syun_009223 [Stephania yunnanensis]|uniref:Uncharacterized protein n=1 Tax=Stephania yunnanensis TaxID=152371 RepID=A0AAP0KG75_9MAGN